jgi:hypothetical protein
MGIVYTITEVEFFSDMGKKNVQNYMGNRDFSTLLSELRTQ